jgi:hypothetical protein
VRCYQQLQQARRDAILPSPRTSCFSIISPGAQTQVAVAPCLRSHSREGWCASFVPAHLADSTSGISCFTITYWPTATLDLGRQQMKNFFLLLVERDDRGRKSLLHACTLLPAALYFAPFGFVLVRVRVRVRARVRHDDNRDRQIMNNMAQ